MPCAIFMEAVGVRRAIFTSSLSPTLMQLKNKVVNQAKKTLSGKIKTHLPKKRLQAQQAQSSPASMWNKLRLGHSVTISSPIFETVTGYSTTVETAGMSQVIMSVQAHVRSAACIGEAEWHFFVNGEFAQR